MRVGAAKERLSVVPSRAAFELDALIRAAVMGGAPARSAMLACGLALAREPMAPWVSSLGDCAASEGFTMACMVLGDAAPHLSVRPHGRLSDPSINEWWSIILDRRERRWGYALPSPRSVLQGTGRLGRLLMHPEPHVVRRILAARATQLSDVLVIASRRPSSPAIVAEVCASLRWMGHVEVREAIASNPFAPTGVALALLPTIPVQALRALTTGPVHPRIQEAAAFYL